MDPRRADRTRDGDERRAGAPRRAPLAEPRAAVAGDQREVRERLDVLDERRPLAVARVRGERRAQPRPRRPALEVREHGGLLARHVPLGAGRHGHARAAAAARAVGRARRPSLERAWAAGAATSTSRAPTALAAASAPSRTRWGARVSNARSLALIGSPSVPLTTTTGRAPAATARELDGGREAGAATPAQAGALDFGDQLRARVGQRPVHGEVAVQRDGTVRGQPGEEALAHGVPLVVVAV